MTSPGPHGMTSLPPQMTSSAQQIITSSPSRQNMELETPSASGLSEMDNQRGMDDQDMEGNRTKRRKLSDHAGNGLVNNQSGKQEGNQEMDVPIYASLVNT